jgi:hypothetical protein
MPSFHDAMTTPAPPEAVWKILYDPARFPRWWGGARRIGEVAASCPVSDLRFEWRLEAVGRGTRISVDVEIPEREAHRLAAQRETIAASLARLADLAQALSR